MDNQITPDYVQGLGNDVATATQQQYSLPQLLQNALIQKFSTANPTVQARNQAVQNLYSAPEEAANKYGGPQTVNVGGGQVPAPGQNPVGEPVSVSNVYYSPLEQRQLQSQYIGAKLAPVMNLTNLLSTQTGGAEGLVNNVRSMYEAQTGAAQKRYDTALDLLKLNMMYGYNPVGNSGSTSGTGSTGRTGEGSEPTGPGGQPLSSDPTKRNFQQVWLNAPLIRREQLEKSYEGSTGFKLWGQPPTGGYQEDLNSLNKSLNLINQAEDLIKQNPKLTEGINGMWQNILTGNSNTFRFADPTAAKLSSTLTQLSAAGERLAIGGRLTGYLLTRLNAAFPGLNKTTEENMNTLDQMKGQAQTALNTIAHASGYDNAQYLPGVDKKNLVATESQNNNTGTTVMTGSDGKQYNVPNAKVEEAKSHGWR